MQINYRKRDLDDFEVKKLINIRNSNLANKQLVSCIHILLNSYREFKLIYSGLDQDGKKEFKSWPIWNLYKNNSSFTNKAEGNKIIAKIKGDK